MNAIDDGWYRIARSHCPQNYGYNGIKLNVPTAGAIIKLRFKDLAGTEGYNAIKTEKAGWRYGFLAYTKDGSRIYGKVYNKATGKAKFKVPRNTEYLWLVVSGAPAEHWPVAMGRQRAAADSSKEEQWPYQVKISGTTVDTSMVK